MARNVDIIIGKDVNGSGRGLILSTSTILALFVRKWTTTTSLCQDIQSQSRDSGRRASEYAATVLHPLVADQAVKKVWWGCVNFIALRSEPGINTRTTDVGTWVAGYFVSLLQMSATERGVSARSYNASTACGNGENSGTCLSLLQPTYTASGAALYEDTTQFRSLPLCIHLEPTINRNKIKGLCLSR